MSFLFPKPQAPASYASDPIPPPVAPPPPPPNPASAPVQTAASQQQRAARSAASGGIAGASMGGTLLTGADGAPQTRTAKSTLGGG